MTSKPSTDKRTGRPPGVGTVARLRNQLLTGGRLKALVDKTYELAMAGDVAAIRILIERVIPPVRTSAAPIRIALPAGTLTEKAHALLQAAADGQIRTDQAAELITAVGRVMQVEQGDEVRRHIEALEAMHGKQP